MESKSAIQIIELASIVVGAAFGILGSTTETKDKVGRLTKWGIIAVAGIVVTNSFSLIQAFLKQREDKITEESRRVTDSVRLVRQYRFEDSLNQNQIRKQDSVLAISNASQDTLFKLQNKTNLLIADAKTSENAQIHIRKTDSLINVNTLSNLSQEAELNKTTTGILNTQGGMQASEQQINVNTLRALNPLMPFGVTFTIRIALHNKLDNQDYLNYQAYEKADVGLHKILSIRNRHDDGHYGITSRPLGNHRFALVLTSKYKYHSDFEFLRYLRASVDFYAKGFDTGKIFSFDPVNKRYHQQAGNLSGTFNLALKKSEQYIFTNDTLYNNNMFPGVYVEYTPDDDCYYFTFYSTDFKFADDGSITATNDMQGCSLLFQLSGFITLSTKLTRLTLHFPPYYSKNYSVPIADSGTWSKFGGLKTRNVLK